MGSKTGFSLALTHWALFIGSLSNMDNWHLFIILSLIAFGIGHAVFRAKIGFWTFLLLITFLVPLLFIYQEGEMYIVILVNVLLGFLFAHRQVIIDIVDDVRDGLGQFFGFFRRLMPERKPKPNPEPTQQQSNQSSNSPWKEEQARREQEAKEQRAQKEPQQPKKEDSQPEAEPQPKAKPQEDQRSNPPVTPPKTEQRTPIEILGLQSRFSTQELKQAYSRESARCHPDKWVSKPEAIRKMMEEEQKLINWAYRQLK